jgi:hypothetical protein
LGDANNYRDIECLGEMEEIIQQIVDDLGWSDDLNSLLKLNNMKENVNIDNSSPPSSSSDISVTKVEDKSTPPPKVSNGDDDEEDGDNNVNESHSDINSSTPHHEDVVCANNNNDNQNAEDIQENDKIANAEPSSLLPLPSD